MADRAPLSDNQKEVRITAMVCVAVVTVLGSLCGVWAANNADNAQINIQEELTKQRAVEVCETLETDASRQLCLISVGEEDG